MLRMRQSGLGRLGTRSLSVDCGSMTQPPTGPIPERPSDINKRVMDEVELELETNLKRKSPRPDDEGPQSSSPDEGD